MADKKTKEVLDGLKRVSAKNASSKNGFDTYDTQDTYPTGVDSVTVVRKNSDLGKAAAKEYSNTKKQFANSSDNKTLVGREAIDYTANTAAGWSGTSPAKAKVRGPQPVPTVHLGKDTGKKDSKFFPITEKKK